MFWTLLPTLALSAPVPAPPQEPVSPWEETLDRVSKSVVSLRVTSVRNFDTEEASVSQGTGFVVDAQRGLILTNRHMVHAGPVVAEAVFLDDEEVELTPIYRDPVHDFGFYRFDPSDVKHMEVLALPLAPEAAKAGMEIRVVGNDAGEKISILDSTLARLDRNAPLYGLDSYNDFNTFYFQAASNTSGGSSGSPVVDALGRAVALNAGGASQSASSFYLPLDRVLPALAKLQRGESVPRGTLQTVFVHTPFDELARLGLSPETEGAVREHFKGQARKGTATPVGFGMLVVERVLPEGPAASLLQPGDILVRIDGEIVTSFVDLESRLDEAVDRKLKIEIDRGGRKIEIEPVVHDLHAITPAEYLEVGRGVLHTLSYMMANNFERPVRGVYLALGGHMWSTAEVPDGALITHVDGEAVPDLDAMQRVLETKADGQRIRLRFLRIADASRSYEKVAVMDRRWYPMQRCVRDDETGLWPCTASPPPPPLKAPLPAEQLPVIADDRVSKSLSRSLVMVDFDIPYPTAGVKDLNYVGVGTVVDAERGLVLVDRDTVPVTLGDMTLTFAGTVRVPGEIVYLHPVHNIAVVHYDPSLLGDLGVVAATLDPSPLKKDDKIWQIGLDASQDLVSSKTRVELIEPLVLGKSQTPRFRDTNLEGIWIEEAVDSYGGVLADKRGHVRALWASFLDQASGDRGFYGMPLSYVMSSLAPVLEGEMPAYRTLGAELVPVPLSQARDRGLSDSRVRELLAHDPDGRRVLEVQAVHGLAPASSLLRPSDLVVSIDGKPVTSPHEIERLQDKPELQFVVLRDAVEVAMTVPTFTLEGRGVTRIVSWAGLVLHEPHDDVAAQQGLDPSGVYIAWLWFGSPAARYGIRPTRRITHVDDVETPDLDSFLAAVASRDDRQPVRLLMEKLDGGKMVETLKLDLQYWPTETIELIDGQWVRRASHEIAKAP